MKVTELNKGLLPENPVDRDLIWIDAAEPVFTTHGVFYDESQGQYVRMPQNVADATSDMVSALNRSTSGGRIKFRTNSKCIAIHAVMFDNDEVHHVCQMEHGFDLCTQNSFYPRSTFAYSLVPGGTMRRSFSATYGTGGEMADFTLHLPTNGKVYKLYIGLTPDSEVEIPTPYKYEKPVVFYGSSITQGSCASRPANIYEAVISRHLDTDFVDLGFGGSCLGEDAVVNYIAGLDMSVFVCDFDHNAPSAEYLKEKHLPIYRTVRAKHPDLPIVFVTAPNIMPDYTWHIPRREVIRKTYDTAIAEGDSNVYFIDGETFFDIEDRDMCTVDTCHPNDLGMYLMAKKMIPVLDGILNK